MRNCGRAFIGNYGYFCYGEVTHGYYSTEIIGVWSGFVISIAKILKSFAGCSVITLALLLFILFYKLINVVHTNCK
jgi:hypothetical protein